MGHIINNVQILPRARPGMFRMSFWPADHTFDEYRCGGNEIGIYLSNENSLAYPVGGMCGFS
jgi:hypothetical protein